MSLLSVSSSLQLSLVQIARCRSAAIEAKKWGVWPHVVHESIIHVASQQGLEHEYTVFQHADDLIRAHGRAGLVFQAGTLRGASAHELAVAIRSDFVTRALGGHVIDLWVDSSGEEDFIHRIMLHIDNPEETRLEFEQIPEFDAEGIAIQLQQELAFAEAQKPAPKKQTKRQEPKNAKRDAKFFDLHQNGKSDGDISAVWNAENPLNRVTKETVRQGISRHRKRLRLRDIS